MVVVKWDSEGSPGVRFIKAALNAFQCVFETDPRALFFVLKLNACYFLLLETWRFIILTDNLEITISSPIITSKVFRAKD